MRGRDLRERILCSMIAFLIASISLAGDSTDVRVRKLVLSLGGGSSYFLGEAGVPGHLNTVPQRFGPALTARLMWHPEHLIRVGVESGWVHFYGYSMEGNGIKGSADLSAIPLLLQWSMRIGPRLQVFAGWGTYRLHSTLELLGRTRSASFSQGYAAAISYSLPLSDRFDAAIEAKWMNAFVTQHHLLAVQCRIDWKFLEW